jgi:hypothetical protein
MTDERAELERQLALWRNRALNAEAKLHRIATSAAELRGKAEQHIVLVDQMLPKGTDHGRDG